MAVTKPAAVVKSASEMPGATARRLAAPAVASPEKASMIPEIFPKRPLNGDTDLVVSSQDMPFSARRTSSAAANCIFTVTACRLLSLPPALGFEELGETWLWSSRYPKAYTVAYGEPACAKACGLAIP